MICVLILSRPLSCYAVTLYYFLYGDNTTDAFWGRYGKIMVQIHKLALQADWAADGPRCVVLTVADERVEAARKHARAAGLKVG